MVEELIRNVSRKSFELETITAMVCKATTLSPPEASDVTYLLEALDLLSRETRELRKALDDILLMVEREGRGKSNPAT